MLSPVSIDWLVCELEYTKNTEQISMKPGRRTHLGPEMTPLPFGADLNADEVDLNMFSLILDLIV